MNGQGPIQISKHAHNKSYSEYNNYQTNNSSMVNQQYSNLNNINQKQNSYTGTRAALNFSNGNIDLNSSKNPNMSIMTNQHKRATSAMKNEIQKIGQPNSSLAEENQVKNFNRPQNMHEKVNLPIAEPQRIELPLFFNTPVRIQNQDILHPKPRNFSSKPAQINNQSNENSRIINFNNNNQLNTSMDQSQINQSFILKDKQNYSINLRNVSEDAGLLDAEEEQKGFITRKVDPSTQLHALRRLRDYEMLAFACRRAGKTRDQGRAYYSMGVLQDNVGKYKAAISAYKQFLAVCKAIGDVHGQALAYNCIGVDYQVMGEENVAYFNDAIEYHEKHNELADVNGQFLACINMGLCYDRLKQYKSSMFNYQEALKLSIKMSNIVGQSIAIGNIGRIGAKGLHDNQDQMKVFIEKYIKLAQELKDTNSEMNANMKLGLLTSFKGNYEEGREYFMKALELAEVEGHENMFNFAKFGYAVSSAETNMNQYLKDYSQVNKLSPIKQKTLQSFM